MKAQQFPKNMRALQEIEADTIYRALFDRSAPDVIRKRFITASHRLHQKRSTQELAMYYNIIKSGYDLEALEVACRYKKVMPLLSLKFRLMVFLAETLPENQGFFINEKTSFMRALWYSTLHSIRTMYKLCRGFYLLARIHPCIR